MYKIENLQFRYNQFIFFIYKHITCLLLNFYYSVPHMFLRRLILQQ